MLFRQLAAEEYV